MRRTWNTSVSPTIGIVVIGTAKIGFGTDFAAAGALCVAAPASASAPVASMVLRSRVFMASPCLSRTCSTAYLDRHAAPGKAMPADTRWHKKGHATARAFQMASDHRYHLISGGSLPPLAASLAITCLCSQTFMVAESLLSPV